MARAIRMPWRSVRTTIPVAGVAVFALSTTGCGLLGMGPGEGPEPSPSPTPVSAGPLFEEAVAALEEAAAIQIQGQFSDPDDTSDVVSTSVTVTNTGAALGTFQARSGSEADYFEADGKLFLKADSDYWLTHDVFNPDGDAYPDHWVRVTQEQFGLDPGGVLAPPKLAESLRAQAPSDNAEAVEEKLDGVVVYRVDLAGGTAWITSEAPHTLVRMQIEELAPADGEGVASRIDASFAEVDTATVEQLYDDLVAYAEEELGSARDARLEVAWAEEELGGDCQTGGACTMIGKVKEISGANRGLHPGAHGRLLHQRRAGREDVQHDRQPEGRRHARTLVLDRLRVGAEPGPGHLPDRVQSQTVHPCTLWGCPRGAGRRAQGAAGGHPVR